MASSQSVSEVTVNLTTRLERARAQTDELFRLLQPEAIYDRPIPERHRLVFYLGHLEAFDWNQICRGALGLRSFHADFDKLFEFGIDPEPGKADTDKPADWPRVDEIARYNLECRRRVDDALGHAPEQVAHVAIEHRQMHAETFAYLMHNMAYERKQPGVCPFEHAGASPAGGMITVPEGDAILGQAPDEFGWDNEFDRHSVHVPEFRIAKYKVTNGQYLRFVQETGANAPHFWSQRDGKWWYRGMFQEIPLPGDWPVYVTHEEASAYARWSGCELPTEEQFHRAASGSRLRGNFDFRRWDPVAVHSDPESESEFGVAQLSGNGWEWTSTVFGPFAGFRPFPFYPGYSANFFDGKHFVMKGASPRTAADLLRPSFRNWFRPNYPYVYATFRVVEKAGPANNSH